MLWAGILFIWELVGIDLEKAKDSGGNAGAIISAIKSPQAVPWVLLVLVGYFAFKLWIEWKQCAEQRREILASRIDFASAWVAAFLAFLLYVYQAISRVQVADVVNGAKGRSLAWGAIIGLLLVTVFIRRARLKSDTSFRILVIFICSLIGIFTILFLRFGTIKYQFVGLAIPFGIAGFALFWYLVDRWMSRSR